MTVRYIVKWSRFFYNVPPFRRFPSFAVFAMFEVATEIANKRMLSRCKDTVLEARTMFKVGEEVLCVDKQRLGVGTQGNITISIPLGIHFRVTLHTPHFEHKTNCAFPNQIKTPAPAAVEFLPLTWRKGGNTRGTPEGKTILSMMLMDVTASTDVTISQAKSG